MQVDHFLAYFENSHRLTVKTCRLLPPERWAFRPTEEIFTSGELIGHIAYSQRAMTEGAVKADFRWIPEEATQSIDSLPKGLAFLDECHAHAIGLYKTLTDVQFQDTIATPFGFEATRSQLAGGMLDHENHHRGQLHTYLRLMGVEGKVLGSLFHDLCFLQLRAKA